ncbi:MAG: bifunctional nicotinamidase/pyrazinamidase [Promethearchaeota archaeon]|nr:MAG: bifunctional nicotinamidase/pyrazinamidase [Candidatus Lokiarchaeota archaeon]
MKIEDLPIGDEIKVNGKRDALLIVDIQNDFIPGGALPVEDGDKIISGINKTAKHFKDNNATIVLTQDWHPPNHKSFASAHPGKSPGDLYESKGIGPVLWPDHCVQNTFGAEFHEDLDINLADKVIQKGTNPEVDSYSGFLDNDKKSKTGLAKYLKSENIERLFICGLALDYCCYYTAMDGVEFGFEVVLIVDLSKGIDNPPGNISNALKDMKDKGIKFTKKDMFK